MAKLQRKPFLVLAVMVHAIKTMKCSKYFISGIDCLTAECNIEDLLLFTIQFLTNRECGFEDMFLIHVDSSRP